MLFELIVVIAVIIFGCIALFTQRSPFLSTILGAGGATLASFLGLFLSIATLLNGQTQSLRIPWNIPFGTFFVEVDPLSAFFLIIIFFLSALCALYGSKYLYVFKNKKSLGASWFFFNLLIASMVMVVIARNAVLFLIAWEVMALTSFFLVTFEHEKESVSQAGWIYLIAAHLGTAFLIVLFITLGNISSSFDFDSFSHINFLIPHTSSFLFLCALIGFGTKAGLIPFHVWLPEAHPAAPSHVSALMSGVMIKTGIYGLIRILMILGHPPTWWGYVLIGMGSLSGIGGILFALAQHDSKKLLAYSSIENIGIITLGLGLGVLGLSADNLPLTILGFLGAILHTLNHSLFKGLLFLGSGSILHVTETREIDKLGGLLKKMPVTGYTFLMGSISVSGLPLLNGFISEFLIYLGAFWGITSDTSVAIPSMLIIASLALIGGLAGACFTKIFGLIFLGEARSNMTQEAHDPTSLMTAPMITLAACCFLIGLLPYFFVVNLSGVIENIISAFDIPSTTAQDSLNGITPLLKNITLVSSSFFFIILLLISIRYFLFSHRKIDSSVTWGCGYAFPSSRMQYTASSFTQPITSFFGFLLGKRKHPSVPGYFPHSISFYSKSIDLFKDKLYRPLFNSIDLPLHYLRRFQYGRIQLYIFYILLTLIILLLWQAGIDL